MKGGPKRVITAPPLRPKGLPKSGPERIVRFIERYCIVPRGHGALQKVKLRAFQREIIRGSFAPRVRTSLVSIPRANGKTSLAAMLAVWNLFDGPPSAEALIVASSQAQAEITLRLARRMVELHPELEQRAQIFRDRLYVPHTDSTLMALPAEPDALHGYDPSLLIVDELHVVTEDVWDAATTAIGKRPESLTFCISTPAKSKESVMWRLVEHGREDSDPAFYFDEFAAPENCDIDDADAWKVANPALSDKNPFLAEDALAEAMRTTREASFRRLRLGQWVYDMSKWMPDEMWTALAADISVHPKMPVVAFFDGSASGDSTGIVACTVPPEGQLPHLFVVGKWENPGDQRWRVPREEVSDAVDEFFQDYNVLELACDPWGWRSEIESWAKRHGAQRVIELPTHVISRMGPATDRFYASAREKQFTQDGDDAMRRHIANAVAKATPHGDVVVKERKSSPNKIDLAVCAIGALDRAAWHAKSGQKRKSKRLVVL